MFLLRSVVGGHAGTHRRHVGYMIGSQKLNFKKIFGRIKIVIQHASKMNVVEMRIFAALYKIR